MATCLICKRNVGTHAGIKQGVYYTSICLACLKANHSVSSGQARWNRQRDMEDHEADTRQPYSGGKPDPKFIHLYPERARQLWSEDEINKAIRS